MNKLYVGIMSVLLLAMSFGATSCASFSKETKEFTAVVTELAASQAVFNNIVLDWHVSVLEAYKAAEQAKAQAAHELATGELLPLESFVVELQMTNPEYDPADLSSEPYIYKDISEIIGDIKDLMKLNLEIAESLDTLNESVQADRGLDPLFSEVKKILADEEVMALVKLYAEQLRSKPVEDN